MTSSFLKIWPICLCWGLITGCVDGSNWLSGSAQYQNSQLDSSQHFSPIEIGVTTKQEVLSRFGKATDRQSSMLDGVDVESLSYSTTKTMIKPYQYIPLIGAVAFWGPLEDQTPSAAISFSTEDRVSGLTISTVRAYGNIRSSEFLNKSDSSTSFYGMRNPDVIHSTTTSPLKLP